MGILSEPFPEKPLTSLERITMKAFKCLLVLCLLALIVGCRESLPKVPPLTDEEPAMLIQVQLEQIPSQRMVMKKLESLLRIFADSDADEEKIDQFLEKIEGSEDENLFSLLFDLISDLKKKKVKTVFCVVEKDFFPRGDKTPHVPFVAFDIHDLGKSQIKSVENAIEDFSIDASKNDNQEIAIFNEGGYLVTNFWDTSENSEYTEEQNEILEEKVSANLLETWPENIKGVLNKYKKCAICVVGKVPFSFQEGLKKECENIERGSDTKAKSYLLSTGENWKNLINDLKKMDYYAAGINFQTETVMISFFMENREEAKSLKEDSLKFLQESLLWVAKDPEFVEMISKSGSDDSDKKGSKELLSEIEGDIMDCIKGISVSQRGNVVTYSFSKEWVKKQKSLVRKFRPENSMEESAPEESSKKDDDF